MSLETSTGAARPPMPAWPAPPSPAALGQARANDANRTSSPVALLGALWDYWIDTAQRSVLFWDVLRQRGNNFYQDQTAGALPVLAYDYELIGDGHSLPHPVNYLLLRIVPPPDAPIDPRKRPYLIVDPRVGHGPACSGCLDEAEIGVALRGSHAVYVVSLRPAPEPGQTLEDIGQAEASFLAEIARRHPDAPRPCVYASCQAGWAVEMLAALAPELTGPIVLNGAPLSYWAGAGGKNPMRYLGGLWGGTWLNAFLTDLGHGTFDGANLVANFESLDPARSLWARQYDLYANIDTEARHYLSFERWWDNLFLLNSEEMEALSENLLIGSRTAANQVQLGDGRTIRIEDITAPIVIFASAGDDSTPPQQALGWIIDVYGSTDAIVRDEQVIVYCLHPDAGHLGIFVAGQVAGKERTASGGVLEFIEALTPGLYEMLIEPDTRPPAGRAGLPEYSIRFVERSLDDLRVLADGHEDERPLATLAAVSELNSTLYKTFLRPWVQLAASAGEADLLRRTHPLRLQHALLSDLNPLMAPVKYWAELARRHRRPAAADNPFRNTEHVVARQVGAALDMYRKLRDGLAEIWFKTIYGPTGLGAFVAAPETPRATPPRLETERRLAERRAGLLARAGVGGFPAAVARMLILLSHANKDAEPRAVVLAHELLDRHPRLRGLSPAEFKAVSLDQFYTLYFDEGLAVATLPRLLASAQERREALDLVQRIVLDRRWPNAAEQAVIERLEAALELAAAPAPALVAHSLPRDRLIDIVGIGPVYERRLNEAGIATFAALAAETPERLRALVGARPWQNLDTASWIAQARARAKKGPEACEAHS